MSNIYDLFNSRKEGLSSLQESYDDFELPEVTLEDFDDPVDALEEIMEESTMDFIELQASLYMDELLVENAMYDDFDEEHIENLMEASIKDNLTKIREKIKEQWAKLVAWFAKTIVQIQNFFSSGEDLVKRYKSQIPGLVKSCDTSVNCYQYRPYTTAISECEKLISAVKASGQSGMYDDVAAGKEGVLSAVDGAADRKSVAKNVKKIFVGTTEKPGAVNISSLDPNILMDYAANKKAMVDGIKKIKANVDLDFKEILNKLKVEQVGTKDDARKTAKKQVAIFQFAISVKTAIINAMISCVKKASSDCKKIIRKAIGGMPDSDTIDKFGVKARKYDMKKEHKKAMKDKRKSLKESLDFEDISFDDEF